MWGPRAAAGAVGGWAGQHRNERAAKPTPVPVWSSGGGRGGKAGRERDWPVGGSQGRCWATQNRADAWRLGRRRATAAPAPAAAARLHERCWATTAAASAAAARAARGARGQSSSQQTGKTRPTQRCPRVVGTPRPSTTHRLAVAAQPLVAWPNAHCRPWVVWPRGHLQHDAPTGLGA